MSVAVSVTFVWLTIVPLIFLPAWLYRWTLKSTFWIYLPLLWVVGPAKLDRKHHWLRVQRIAGDLIGVAFSVVVILLGVVKIRIWQKRTGLAEWLNSSALGRFFGDYIAPDRMPAWQYASMINALLAIVMFWIAKSSLAALEEERPWPVVPIDRGLRIAMGARRLLTLYTTVVLIYITLKQGFPPLGEFFPAQ